MEAPRSQCLKERLKNMVTESLMLRKDEAHAQVLDTHLTRGVRASSFKDERNPNAFSFSENVVVNIGPCISQKKLE